MFRPRHYAVAAAFMTILAVVQYCATVYDKKVWFRGPHGSNKEKGRVDDKMTRLARQALEKVAPFWDFLSFDKKQMQEMFQMAQTLIDIHPYMDWEALRDNYVIASLSSSDDTNDSQRRNLKARRHRARKRRGPQSVSSQVQNDLMEKLSELKGMNKEDDGEDIAAAQATVELDRDTDRSGVDPVVYLPQYEQGACPNSNPSAEQVPCAPDGLFDICDKYNTKGSFKECFFECKPSFCCIHDGPKPDPTSEYALTLETLGVNGNCNTDANCAQYWPCYIVWWKLHDTIGPATEWRLEQNDVPFYNSTDDTDFKVELEKFETEILMHHFNNPTEIIRLGLAPDPDDANGGQKFNTDKIFLDPQYWETNL